MVQTISRRIANLQPPALIITDENHHSKARSYIKIYKAFPEAHRIGVTATPVRLDGSGLKDVNDKLVIGVDAKWLINNHYLAPYDYYAPSLVDLTGLKTVRGEFDIKSAEKLMLKKAIFGDVIENYKKLANGRQAICYCVSVKHSVAMAQAFNDAFDVPDCGCAILLRPTKSLTLYIQQSMRCMRYKSGKRAVIIDHVGNYARFGLPDQHREWTLEGKPKRSTKNKSKDDVNIRECTNCFRIFPAVVNGEKVTVCPFCGYVFPEPGRDIREEKQAVLQKIEGFVLNYDSPDQCNTYQELIAYAKRKGYKPGWAYYQAKSKGML